MSSSIGLNDLSLDRGISLDSTRPISSEMRDETLSTTDTTSINKKRNVRLVYCSDGIVEECDEDEIEKQRAEKEEKEKQIELRRKMDIEAKNMTWVPWIGYMANKSANKTLEVCDYMGEKLAWWFGITKPKFMYEIEEYHRLRKEHESRINPDDIAEEIVVETISTSETNLVNDRLEDETEQRLFNSDKTEIQMRSAPSGSTAAAAAAAASASNDEIKRSIANNLFQNN